VRKFRFFYVAPLFALIALSAWALSSPIGSSPDDDFHLTSIWCGNTANTSACLPGPTAETREVPEAVHLAPTCYYGNGAQSAACQANSFSLDPTPSVTTSRGNFTGAYPPLYYSAMSVFVGSNILASVVLMRIVNIALFVGMTTLLFALLPQRRRPTLVLAWITTTVPLGLFLLSSNNPSAWAIAGVGSAWIALLGYFESSGRRKAGLGAVFVAAALMAAGSRADAAAFVGLSIVAVFVLAIRRDKRFLLDAALPVIVGGICLWLFLSSRQSGSGLHGFTSNPQVVVDPGSSGSTDALGQILGNLLNVPALWAGVFGNWGLGWLDTTMPGVVIFGAVSVFAAVAFVCLRSVSRRKVLALAIVGVVLWVLPTYVLFKSSNAVGDAVQPRYLLPLIVLFAGLAMLQVGNGRLTLRKPQAVLLITVLSLVQIVSLYTNMRRYIQGVGGGGWNLDHGIKWWWDMPFSPMFVLIVGSAAYTGLLIVLVRRLFRAVELPTESFRIDGSVG
jgi:hypothetical protein